MSSQLSGSVSPQTEIPKVEDGCRQAHANATGHNGGSWYCTLHLQGDTTVHIAGSGRNENMCYAAWTNDSFWETSDELNTVSWEVAVSHVEVEPISPDQINKTIIGLVSIVNQITNTPEV